MINDDRDANQEGTKVLSPEHSLRNRAVTVPEVRPSFGRKENHSGTVGDCTRDEDSEKSVSNMTKSREVIVVRAPRKREEERNDPRGSQPPIIPSHALSSNATPTNHEEPQNFHDIEEIQSLHLSSSANAQANADIRQSTCALSTFLSYGFLRLGRWSTGSRMTIPLTHPSEYPADSRDLMRAARYGSCARGLRDQSRSQKYRSHRLRRNSSVVRQIYRPGGGNRICNLDSVHPPRFLKEGSPEDEKIFGAWHPKVSSSTRASLRLFPLGRKIGTAMHPTFIYTDEAQRSFPVVW